MHANFVRGTMYVTCTSESGAVPVRGKLKFSRQCAQHTLLVPSWSNTLESLPSRDSLPFILGTGSTTRAVAISARSKRARDKVRMTEINENDDGSNDAEEGSGR